MILGIIDVEKEKDIVKIRQIIKSLCFKIGFNNIETIKITTAASELTRNQYEHASGGKILIELVKNLNVLGFKLIFKDKGYGIKNLDKIINGKYKSPKGLGIGLLGAKKLMDDFKIESDENGTTVEIIKW
ncbi:MAG: ATP-binding protein, partial [Candidatus Hodarchaeota archaeon]